MQKNKFHTIDEAIEDIAKGKMVILVDDEDRENEGDLAIAAEKVTPETINFMAKHGRGLICLPMTGDRLDALRIPPMTQLNTSAQGTAFHVSIGAKGKITSMGSLKPGNPVNLEFDLIAKYVERLMEFRKDGTP